VSVHVSRIHLESRMLIPSLLLSYSDECGVGSFCADCAPSWTTCQYCERNHCVDCSEGCKNICQGNGCNRANCNGLDSRGFNISSTNTDCTDEKNGRKETVRQYMDGDLPHSFCGDCYPGGMNILD